MDARVRLDHTLLAIDGEHEVHALLELSAPDAEAGRPRPPLGVALVIDRSGSMAGAKLETARACGAWLAGRLRADDLVALVDFDDEARVLLPLAPAGNGGLAAALASIAPGGTTNLSGGWLLGRRELAAAPDGVPRTLLLLTDGLANAGITDPATLVGLARTAAAAGVTTATIGFGDGFDEDLLTAMADAGGGRSHHAPTVDAAPAIFAEELDGLLRLVGHGLTVDVLPGPGVQVADVLEAYPSAPCDGGVRLSLGDVHAGATRSLTLRLGVPYLAALGPVAVARLVVRYVAVGEELEERTLEVPVVANAVSAAEAAAAPDAEVVERVLLLRAAQARDASLRLADAGDHAAAQTLLGGMRDELRCAGSPVAAAEADRLDAILPAFAPAAYDPAARKRVRYEAVRARRGRRPPA